MDKRKIMASVSLVMNLAMLIMVTYCTSLYFFQTGVGNMAVDGAECFRYFTIDSNILCALTGIFVIVGDVFILIGKYTKLPRCLILIKQVGTVSITVTFLTVLFFLGPTQGYGIMFAGGNLFMHLICPLLAIISYLFLESYECVGNSFLQSLYGLIPVIVYGAVYLTMVVILDDGWPDFYGFNRGGMWYVSILAMLAATYVISLGLMALYKLVQKWLC